MSLFFFFFNDTATTEIYTLSLHDALPIYALRVVPDVELVVDLDGLGDGRRNGLRGWMVVTGLVGVPLAGRDRKSTRLNSSHLVISYAVFCLKKKKICIVIFSISVMTVSKT